jgi:FixJ family two-component response regulator
MTLVGEWSRARERIYERWCWLYPSLWASNKRKDVGGRARAASETDSLTSRECQVMALVVSGWLSKRAAGELGISEVKVKEHRGQVVRKMKAVGPRNR